ncbi:hypothetical protein R1T08_00640 [Streptomyces sp. SBC-4]|nr:hypothetical protein [Streptomyces sp. SBC-4]MDV5142870.1 hypothetical protein [Streptomyces sp. SBC-4]
MWTWDPGDAEALMTDQERTECSAVLNSMREWDGITEIKWAAGGTKTAAIVGGAAVLIDYTTKACSSAPPTACPCTPWRCCPTTGSRS